MYPFLRLLLEFRAMRRLPALPLTGTHVSSHTCLPWDVDPWRELNNGRTLTLYDLGRVPMAIRTGLVRVLGPNGWGITVAGNTCRYRRRVRMFDRITMVSRCIGWDHRFIYMEQSMWVRGECTSHMVLRTAVTSKDGIVPPARVLEALGQPVESPALPAWVQGWIAAEAERHWPPQGA